MKAGLNTTKIIVAVKTARISVFTVALATTVLEVFYTVFIFTFTKYLNILAEFLPNLGCPGSTVTVPVAIFTYK